MQKLLLHDFTVQSLAVTKATPELPLLWTAEPVNAQQTPYTALLQCCRSRPQSAIQLGHQNSNRRPGSHPAEGRAED